ncbi:MAG: glycosyltransferase [Bdellovibrionaceae bacterium]|nr:glycosyltransferase [Pseudobdellovibrionaceae bacterium]
MGEVQTVYVQSELVRDLFLTDFPNANVVVAPFKLLERREEDVKLKHDFVYPGSGDPHKNHRNLFEARKSLVTRAFIRAWRVTLHSSNTELLSYISSLQDSGVKIFNLGSLSHEEVLGLYQQCGALIFPSQTESFGLPLLEARSLGLPILASELDYVREFVAPAQTFDPYSSKSIARAVRRFLSLELPEKKIYSAREFLGMLE